MLSRDLGNGSYPEVTSFNRKSPRRRFRRPKTRICCTFHFLQGCSSQYEAVTWQKMASREFRIPEVTGKWHHLTGSHLKESLGGQKPAYYVHFTSYKAVARSSKPSRQEMASCDVRGTEVTWKWRHLTGSHLEGALEGQKLAYAVHFTSYMAVAHSRRQSRDRKWCHVISGYRKWPGSDVIWSEVTWKGL